MFSASANAASTAVRAQKDLFDAHQNIFRQEYESVGIFILQAPLYLGPLQGSLSLATTPGWSITSNQTGDYAR